MAGVQQQAAAPAGERPDGAPGTGDIAVEDPATGAVLAHVPDLGPDSIADMARRGRASHAPKYLADERLRSRVILAAGKWSSAAGARGDVDEERRGDEDDVCTA